jgi:hypothetical protein
VRTHCGPRSSKGAAQCLRTVVCVGPSPVRTPELSSLALEKRLRRRRKRAPYANAAAPCINAARPVESFIELCGPAVCTQRRVGAAASGGKPDLDWHGRLTPENAERTSRQTERTSRAIQGDAGEA